MILDPLTEVKPKLFGTNYIKRKFYRDVDDDSKGEFRG